VLNVTSLLITRKYNRKQNIVRTQYTNPNSTNPALVKIKMQEIKPKSRRACKNCLCVHIIVNLYTVPYILVHCNDRWSS